MEKTELLEKYIEYVSREGKRPATISKFSFAIGVKESEFYAHFSNLNQIEQFYWQQLHQILLQKLTQEEVYANYSVREKFLSYAYALVERLKENRSFVQVILKNHWNVLKQYKDDLKSYVETLIAEGTQKGEIHDRILLSTYYPNLMVQEIVSVIHFWAKDESQNFEKTDVFIEKSMNFVMDLLSRNWVDTGLDLIKTLFQKS
ncbi:MAG: TetR family transcriptional regulator C-terminal domain-containing protein [Bacteroidia bacterium]|nr:TetR family transcriptional regulator C-terminal domain-containing protein [Bacteroidia bacterium]MDW8301907.1 hypothetical protein [Bacteroidia bacterium]